MAGATLEFDSKKALDAIDRAAQAMGNPQELLTDLGQYLLPETQKRFSTQASPDGTPWAALSPRYLKRKKKNKDKILVLNGWLSGQLAAQVNDNELLIGSNRKYAAIHQFGGTINIAARSQQAFFKQGRDGSVGNRFVKESKSNFAQRVTLGAYTITIPARPFLGISTDDENYIVERSLELLEKALGTKGP